MDKLMKLYRYHHIKSEPFLGDDFVVTEKIHGSNFAIGYIENSLRIQSRNKIISQRCNEFGLSEIIEPLIRIVEKLKDILEFNFLIYGEIFGKTIPALKYYDDESVSVFGSEKVFFRAFDLYDVDENTYVKYTDAVVLFERIGLPYLPILDIDYKTVDDLYVTVEKYQSAFSEKCVEGFVVKKNENESARSRNIFKVVRKEFREKKVEPLKKSKMKSYVTYNGFVSAYSKIGNHPEEVKEEIIRDALKKIMAAVRGQVKEEVEKQFPKFQEKFQQESD